ncbi:BnaC03g69160D [Brassica napus]|uniref:BnaC03g69160D protein n=1 Tax=Brassica napus TaxID=3708 RepID=A0A078ICH2_BRANA|nr:BnaC03g69160D [Brassica napus]
MSDCDGNFMDDFSPLTSPRIRDALAMLDQNDNGLNSISETFPQTNIPPDPQSEQRSGGLRDRMAAKLGFDIPPLEIGRVSPSANLFSNPILVSSPILVISPGFSLSPFLQSPNMLSNSSSQIVPPCPIPNDAPPETVESSGDAHATMIISNNNLPHQPIEVDLPPQGGSDDIPTENSGAPLVPSFDSEVVAEADVVNPISLESGSKDDNKDKEYNQEEDKVEDHNVVVEPPSRKRKSQVNIKENMVSNIIGVTRLNKTQRVIIQVESEEDHPDDGFRWRKYGQKVVTGNANPRSYYRCTYTGCEVKKLVEKNVDNVKLVVATYDGIHEHVPPPERIRKSSAKNQSGSSISQDPTLGLGILPVNQNHGSVNRDDETMTDRVISDGTEVYKAIRD